MSLSSTNAPSGSEEQPGLILLTGRISRQVWFERAQERNIPIYCFREDASWEKDFATEIIPLTPHKHERLDEIIEAAVELAERRPVGGVVAFHDFAMPASAAIATALDLPGLRVDLGEILSNKSTMRTAFATADLPSAQSIPANTWEEVEQAAVKVGYPLILKPSGGAGSWGVVRVDRVEDLPRAFEHSRSAVENLGEEVFFLVEEYLDGLEVTVDAIKFRGDVMWQGVAQKPQPMNGPFFAEVEYVMPASLPAKEIEALRAVNMQMLEKLRFPDGVSHTEYRLTSSGPRLLETHARVSGQQNHRTYEAALGIDLVGAAIDCAMGRTPQVTEHRQGFASYRCIEPRFSGIFTDVEGIDKALAVPHVSEVLITAKPGDEIVTLPRSAQTSLGYIFAEAPTFDEVRAATAEAERQLTVQMEPLTE